MQDSEPQSVKPTLERNQKLAIFVLAVFGFFIIVLWLVQFNKSLTEPFQYKGSATSTDQIDPTVSASDQALKTKDTDGDGLSDWDELNIYKISPYIADSDSDGIIDGQEVNKGTDPNCAEGKDCSASTDIATTTGPSTSIQPSTATVSQTGTSTSGYQPSLSIGSSTEEANLQTMLNGQMDATTLRKTLLDSGADPKMLSALSDEALMSNYKQVLSNNKTN